MRRARGEQAPVVKALEENTDSLGPAWMGLPRCLADIAAIPWGTERRFGSHRRSPSRLAAKVTSVAAVPGSSSCPRSEEIKHRLSRLELCSPPGVKGPSVTAQLLRSLRFQVFACGAASLSKYKWEIPLAVKSCIL